MPVRSEDKRRFAHFAAGGAAFDAAQPGGPFGLDVAALEAKIADLTFTLKPVPAGDMAVFEQYAAGLPAPTLPDPAFDAYIKAATRV